MWSVQLLSQLLGTQDHLTLPTHPQPPAAARDSLQCFYAWQPQLRDSKRTLLFFPGKPLLDLGGPEDYHLRWAALAEPDWPSAGHFKSRVAAGRSSLSDKRFPYL